MVQPRVSTGPSDVSPTSLAGIPRLGSSTDNFVLRNQQLAQEKAQLDMDDNDRFLEAKRQTNGQLDDLQAQRQKARSDGMRRVDEQLDRYNRFVNQYASAEIDPDRWMRGRSENSIGLMAIAAGMRAGEGRNPALDLIESNSRRDVEVQREAIERKGNAAGMVQNAYAMARQMTADRDDAFRLATDAVTERSLRELELIAMSSQNPRLRNALQTSVNAARAQLTQQRVLAAGRSSARYLAGSSGPQGVWTKGEVKPLTLDVGPSGKYYDQIGYFGDQPFLAGTPKEAEEVTNAYSQTQSAINNLSNLRANADKIGLKDDAFVLKSQIAKLAGVDEVFALMEMKDAFGLGVLSGPDLALLEKLTAGGKAKWGDIKALIRRTEVNLEQRFITRSRAKGYKGPIRFDRVEAPPPPPTYDTAFRRVIDPRLSRKDRTASVDAMLVAMDRDAVRDTNGEAVDKQETMALDTRLHTIGTALESVESEREQRQLALAEAERVHKDAPGVSNVEAKRAEFNTVNDVYNRLLHAERQAKTRYKKALKKESIDADSETMLERNEPEAELRRYEDMGRSGNN